MKLALLWACLAFAGGSDAKFFSCEKDSDCVLSTKCSCAAKCAVAKKGQADFEKRKKIRVACKPETAGHKVATKATCVDHLCKDDGTI